ncbi:unnamed protein product, partial [Mesorhabditis belari]|uniref:C2H2-type domain-containing protein n=1 Tax=Mesorhabditis belari TaxID=2138241 RepID=A0AAF3J845_9BILA
MPATKRARRYGGPRVKGIEKQHESPIESRNNYSMSYQISPDNMENLKLHQPADIDHNHIRHEALEAQSSSINHEAQMAKCLFEQCPSHLEITGPAHLFDHMITHASTRRFRCSECGTPKNRRSAFKEHKVNRIKCRGEMIDEINLKMIEENA